VDPLLPSSHATGGAPSESHGQPHEHRSQGHPCGARTRSGGSCRKYPAPGRSRCRLHGGAPGSGAPKGKKNGSYRHGEHTKEAVQERRWLKSLLQNLQLAKAPS
jgi:glucans biosynthesis protein